MPAARRSPDVFINCPLDQEYAPLFDALVFAVLDCGYTPRCAVEIDDSGQSRMDKIYDLIGNARYGIHDISRTELDSGTRLPRFNMPFELGLFLGAKRFGTGAHSSKACLVLDRCRYRYQKYLSDIAGQGVRAHGGRVKHLILAVRNWLRPLTQGRILPGGAEINRRYQGFRRSLPDLCQKFTLDRGVLEFADYTYLIVSWLEEEDRQERSRRGLRRRLPS
jgi:hypothetical protein